MCVQSLSYVRLFATRQAPPSMGFSRQEYWSGLPFPSLEDIPNPGIEPVSPESPALQKDSLPSEPPGSLQIWTTMPTPQFTNTGFLEARQHDWRMQNSTWRWRPSVQGQDERSTWGQCSSVEGTVASDRLLCNHGNHGQVTKPLWVWGILFFWNLQITVIVTSAPLRYCNEFYTHVYIHTYIYTYMHICIHCI